MSTCPPNPTSVAYMLGRFLEANGLAGVRQLFDDAITTGMSDVAVETAAFMQEHEIETAADAYLAAVKAGDPRWAPLAEVELASLLEDADVTGAMHRYSVAVTSGHPDAAPLARLKLGTWLERVGAIDRARDCYLAAINSGHSSIAPRAALDLGLLLLEEDPALAAQGLIVAETLGDAETSARASLLLGLILEDFDAGEAADAYATAITSDDSEVAPLAALMLGWFVRESDPTRAEWAFKRAATAEGHLCAARAAFDLGVLLIDNGGETWLRRAAASDDKNNATRARSFLSLLQRARVDASPGSKADLVRALHLYEASLSRAVLEMREMITSPIEVP